eukprot:1157287-Pelagomonas_calceolata.AAC.3
MQPAATVLLSCSASFIVGRHLQVMPASMTMLPHSLHCTYLGKDNLSIECQHRPPSHHLTSAALVSVPPPFPANPEQGP